MPIISCECGQRLKLKGAPAAAQRVRCPACGATLGVSASPAASSAHDQTDDDLPAFGGYDLMPQTASPSGFVAARAPAPVAAEVRPERLGRPARSSKPKARATSSGFALTYPVSGPDGLSMLVVLPPALTLTSLFSIGLVPGYVLGDNEVATMGALLMAIPMAFLLAGAIGYCLMFICDVVRANAYGEAQLPRIPAWTLGGVAGALARGFWAVGCGLVLAAPPVLAHGIPSWSARTSDWLIVALLAAPGLVYAQLALAAMVLFEDVRASNPVTVASALLRTGSRALRVCLLTAAYATAASAVIPLLFRLRGMWAIAGLWTFWLVVLYLGMLVARALGVFCHRNAHALGWFTERPQWGVRGA